MGNIIQNSLAPPQKLKDYYNQLDACGNYFIKNIIPTNKYLLTDDFIESPNKIYKLQLKNGNLILSDKDNSVKWETNTTAGIKFVVKSNGDCILYDSNENSIWKLSDYRPYWFTTIKPKLSEQYNKNPEHPDKNLENLSTTLVLNDSGLIIVYTSLFQMAWTGTDIIATIPNEDVYTLPPTQEELVKYTTIFYGIIGGLGLLVLILIIIIIVVASKKNKNRNRKKNKK